MLAVAGCMTVMALAAPAYATHPSVTQAEALYVAFEYEQAIALLDPFTKGEGRADPEAFALLGKTYAVIGRVAAAEDAFARLLELDSTYDLPDGTSPRILLVFRHAQQLFKARQEEALAERLRSTRESVRVLAEFPDGSTGGEDVVFSAQITDPHGAVDSVKLIYRELAALADSSVALTRTSSQTWMGLLPGAVTASEDGLALQARIEALDADERRLAAIPPAPQFRTLKFRPGQGRRPGLHQRWWFWAIIGGVAVAGAAVAVGLSTQTNDPSDLPPFEFPQ